MSEVSPTDVSFEIAKELKERAEQRASLLQLQVDALQAKVDLLETQLTHAQLRQQEAETLLELTQIDRQYWHKRHDELAREVAAFDAVVGHLKEITKNSLR